LLSPWLRARPWFQLINYYGYPLTAPGTLDMSVVRDPDPESQADLAALDASLAPFLALGYRGQCGVGYDFSGDAEHTGSIAQIAANLRERHGCLVIGEAVPLTAGAPDRPLTASLPWIASDLYLAANDAGGTWVFNREIENVFVSLESAGLTDGQLLGWHQRGWSFLSFRNEYHAKVLNLWKKGAVS